MSVVHSGYRIEPATGFVARALDSFVWAVTSALFGALITSVTVFAVSSLIPGELKSTTSVVDVYSILVMPRVVPWPITAACSN